MPITHNTMRIQRVAPACAIVVCFSTRESDTVDRRLTEQPPWPHKEDQKKQEIDDHI
jgi:hypothetical protein